MLELEAALARILAATPAPASERIPLPAADGRVLAQGIAAPMDLPPFDNSAMDGYAVRAADVADATPEKPARLRLRGIIAAGDSFTGELSRGECLRVFTGSPMPHGADAVVMQEDSRVDPAGADSVWVLDPVRARENVRFRGEDVTRDTVLAAAGDRLTPPNMSVLAATGVAEVEAGVRPVVGLLATGSELREAGQPLAPGQIYESNRTALAPLVIRAGGVPRIYPLVADRLKATESALEEALNECDVVVTSGGASVGEWDFVKAAFEKVGGQLQFWKVAIRPGKPFIFGQRRGQCLFGLPGNPVSAFVTFLLLVRPALLRWQGASDVALPAYGGALAEPLANPGDRRHFIRVRVDEAGKVFSAGLQASHALGSLASANGLVDMARQSALAAGAVVRVLRWD